MSTIRMGVVADDITGANDIGIMFARAGYETHVYTIGADGSFAFAPGGAAPPDICMLDALGQQFALVVLGFPKNGRTTVDGIHYVHGQRLEDSPFRDDPIHPMTRSNLVEIL